MADISILKEILGDEIIRGFSDSSIFEIIVNSDGKLFFESNKGKNFIANVCTRKMRSAISVICDLTNSFISAKNPDISVDLPADFPFLGARANLVIPPMVKSASLTIRKHSNHSSDLESALASGVLDSDSFEIIKNAIGNYENIVIAGKPQSGKTTLVRAILNSLKDYSNIKDRVLVLEETREIGVDLEDVEYLQTIESVRDMTDLTRSSVRMRPNRIIVGEVRDSSAYGMLQAWNTGSSGGICTIHANSCVSIPQRLIDLCKGGGTDNVESLIALTMNILVFIEHDINTRALD
jgi:type IV secretion system protein TrbB